VTGPEPATNLPFRWDLVRPDQLGRLLDGCEPPDLWFVDELVGASALVLARSADSRLVFVGRSADSVFDLLSGVLADTGWCDRLDRMPFSFRGDADELTPAEVAQARAILAACGTAPDRLAHAGQKTTFVDLVARGYTFTNLYRLLRQWTNEQRQPWNAVRRNLRFVGITGEGKPSPNTWRWHQHVDWTNELPAGSVLNVSFPPGVWSYFGNHQVKITRSFMPKHWGQPDPDGPRHDEKARQALAEAVALVEHGRKRDTRRTIARTMTREPAFAEAWLRRLVTQLK
jgi:hypothetical protein